MRWLGLPIGQAWPRSSTSSTAPSTRKRMSQRYGTGRAPVPCDGHAMRCDRRAIELRSRSSRWCHGRRRAPDHRLGARRRRGRHAAAPLSVPSRRARCRLHARRRRADARCRRRLDGRSRSTGRLLQRLRSCSRRPPTGTTCCRRIGCFFRCGRGQACLWSAWPTPDLRDRRLAAVGPSAAARPSAACRRTRSHRPTSEPAVRSVSTVADLARWERVAIDGYPLPDFRMPRPAASPPPALLDDERLRFFVGLDGDRAGRRRRFVHVPRHRLARPTASRCPQSRRRGYWRRLAIERLRATPDLWMAGVFSDFSRPGAETLGFVPLLRLTLWILDRP